MKVSVIVPNYNHARYLRQRIDSILAQTYTDFELILLDDKSTDNSRAVLESYRGNPHVACILLNDTNTGSPFVQWERGIAHAKGEYIWIAESDDYAHPDFLAACTEQLDRHPDAVLCHTGSHIIDSDGQPLNENYDHWREDGKACVYSPQPYLRRNMTFRDECYNASKVLFRRSAFLRIPKTYASFRCAGDWLFMASLIRQGKVVVVHRKLNYYRWHHTSTTTLSQQSTLWLHEKINLYAQLFRIVEYPAYCRWLVCGLVAKYIKRQRADKAEKAHLRASAAQQLGMRPWHYYAGRVNKLLSNIMPWLPEGKSYCLSC